MAQNGTQQGRIDNREGTQLAWKRLAGRSPTVVFLPGLHSDMTGDKATALLTLCQMQGQAMLLFDYSGHGASEGAFIDGSIGRWTADALAAIDQLTEGAIVLVGSSMGGWIALLAALARPDRVVGLVGVAAAPDFTERIWQGLDAAQRAELAVQGRTALRGGYGEPMPITRHLIEDGRKHLLLNGAIPITCPVRLIQGQADPDVPWQTAPLLAERLQSSDVQVTLVKDGGHRLSRPGDLALLCQALLPLLRVQDGA